MRKNVLMLDPTTRIGIGSSQEILEIPTVIDMQAPAGNKISAPATNHPPKYHLDASSGQISVRCTSGPNHMCDVAGSLVGRELVPKVAKLPGDCPAIGVTRGTLAAGIGKTHSLLDSYFVDVTHSESTTQNVADVTIAFSHLSLTSSKKVTCRRKMAVGSPQRDANKAMKPENRKPQAPGNSEPSSPPTRKSFMLFSTLHDKYDDIQLPLKKRHRCSLYHPQDSSTSLWPSSKRILHETIIEEEELLLPYQPERCSPSNQHHVI